MVDEEKLAEQVEKRKTSLIQEIPPKLMLTFFGYVLFIISFPVPNKGILLVIGALVIIFLSKRKITETKKIDYKEAIAIIKTTLKDMRKSGVIQPYMKFDVSMYAEIKVISDFLKYWYGGIKFTNNWGGITYVEWKVWLTKDMYGVPAFSEALSEVTGREYPPVKIPAMMKKFMKNLTKTDIGKLMEN